MEYKNKPTEWTPAPEDTMTPNDIERVVDEILEQAEKAKANETQLDRIERYMGIWSNQIIKELESLNGHLYEIKEKLDKGKTIKLDPDTLMVSSVGALSPDGKFLVGNDQELKITHGTIDTKEFKMKNYGDDQDE